jgi:hypothetical protein
MSNFKSENLIIIIVCVVYVVRNSALLCCVCYVTANGLAGTNYSGLGGYVLSWEFLSLR